MSAPVRAGVPDCALADTVESAASKVAATVSVVREGVIRLDEGEACMPPGENAFRDVAPVADSSVSSAQIAETQFRGRPLAQPGTPALRTAMTRLARLLAHAQRRVAHASLAVCVRVVLVRVVLVRVALVRVALVRVVLVSGVLASGCGAREEATPVPVTTREVTGSVAERIATVSRMLSPLPPIAVAMLDANAFVVQRGDGEFGPSDFTSYAAITVAATDLPAWSAALGAAAPPDSAPEYVAPDSVLAWWVPNAEFTQLEFYFESNTTARDRGWVAVDRRRNRIYVYSFTM